MSAYLDDDDDDVAGLEGRLSVYPDGSLVINNVRRTDYGWYKCRPSTGVAVPSEAVAYLNVTCEFWTLTVLLVVNKALQQQSFCHFFIWVWFYDGLWQTQAVYQIWNR